MSINLLTIHATTHATTRETIHATTHATTFRTRAGAPADVGQAAVLDLLAAGGLTAETVFDGDAQGCPFCASQVVSKAA